MKAAWIFIGVAMFVTCVAAWVMDERGDEESAEMWGCAMFALGLAALILYGCEHMVMRPSATEPMERPIVYDQPLELKD